MLAQTLALAGEPRLFTRFPDARSRGSSAPTASTSSRSRSSRSRTAPAIEPTGDAVAGDVDKRPPLEFPLFTHAQRAGDRTRSAIRGRLPRRSPATRRRRPTSTP